MSKVGADNPTIQHIVGLSRSLLHLQRIVLHILEALTLLHHEPSGGGSVVAARLCIELLLKQRTGEDIKHSRVRIAVGVRHIQRVTGRLRSGSSCTSTTLSHGCIQDQVGGSQLTRRNQNHIGVDQDTLGGIRISEATELQPSCLDVGPVLEVVAGQGVVIAKGVGVGVVSSSLPVERIVYTNDGVNDFEFLAISKLLTQSSSIPKNVTSEVKEDCFFEDVNRQSVFTGLWSLNPTLTELGPRMRFTRSPTLRHITNGVDANNLLTVELGSFSRHELIADESRILESFQNLDFDQTTSEDGVSVDVEER